MPTHAPAPTGTVDLDQLADELLAGVAALDEQEQRLAVELYRLLAGGGPVTHRQLGERVGLSAEEVSKLLGSWPGVFYDDEGNVVSLWGLTTGARLSSR